MNKHLLPKTESYKAKRDWGKICCMIVGAIIIIGCIKTFC